MTCAGCKAFFSKIEGSTFIARCLLKLDLNNTFEGVSKGHYWKEYTFRPAGVSYEADCPFKSLTDEELKENEAKKALESL